MVAFCQFLGGKKRIAVMADMGLTKKQVHAAA